MMELLASVNIEDLILVGTAMGLFGGGQALLGRRKNGKGFNKALCDEKHKNINNKLDSVEQHQVSIGVKLDRLIEHFL